MGDSSAVPLKVKTGTPAGDPQQHLNVEIKARAADLSAARQVLRDEKARFVGEDHQIDTYFRSSSGRLKLREGTIEKSLIYYERPDLAGPKDSHVVLYHPKETESLKEILMRSMDVMAVVDKRREIYFIDNVKFHLDRVGRLGEFIEIEAIDYEGSLGREYLLEQCNRYIDRLGVRQADLVEVSYSDLILGMGEQA